LKLQNLEKALSFYDLSVDISSKLFSGYPDIYSERNTLLQLKLLENQGSFEKALDISLDYLKNGNSHFFISHYRSTLAKKISRLYLQLGEPQMAIRYLDTAYTLAQECHKIETKRIETTLQTLHNSILSKERKINLKQQSALSYQKIVAEKTITKQSIWIDLR